MSFDAWLAFCASHTVLCLTPGPAVSLVVSVALARGAAAGMAAAVGVLLVNVLWFALSATGIAAVVVASHALFTALEWIGAAYLMWLGLGMLFGGARPTASTSSEVAGRALRRGVVVQGSNPNALLFFTTLLPQFIRPSAPIARQVMVLGASSVIIELVVLATYVVLAARARDAAGARLADPLRRVGGAVLLATGARLAVLRLG